MHTDETNSSENYHWQLHDLDAWARTYLSLDEPFPASVRNTSISKSEYICLFAKEKTFGLSGTIPLADSDDQGPLVSDGELFVYPPNKQRSLLAKFVQKDINASGGVIMTFDNSIAKGSFTLYINESTGNRQVWGEIDATVYPDLHFDERLYLRPINPRN